MKLIPFAISFSVILGHFLVRVAPNISEALTTWGGLVTMKPITALCFLFASGIPVAMEGKAKKEMIELGIAIVATLSVGFIGVAYATNEPLTVGFNVPSWGTGVMFSGFAIACFRPSRLRFSAWSAIVLCVIALHGHILNIPALFYYVEDWSTAMARPTLVCGMIIGCLILREERKFEDIAEKLQ